MKTAIVCKQAAAAIGPYSQAVRAGDFLFISGQIGLDPESGKFVSDTVEGQTEQCLKSITAILQQAGLSAKHVVKTTVLLADMNDFSTVNQLYAKIFLPHGDTGSHEEAAPARAAYAVKSLPKNALVEIEAIAYAKAA